MRLSSLLVRPQPALYGVLALALSVLASPHTARAAAEVDEPCGRIGDWSARCDEGLTCRTFASLGAWYIGLCTAAVTPGCKGDADCPHGTCDGGTRCDGKRCTPPPRQCNVCGDGSTLRCKRAALPCPDGQVREIVEGCYGACVDRQTCEPNSCEYGGKTYEVGDSFPADDGCNTCGCSEDGLVVCTLRACASCDYEDPRRAWISQDPAECKLVNFLCSEGMKPFVEPECGCGCEEAGEPPEEPEAKCHVAGCSGQLCVPEGEDPPTTCEERPEYACYEDATCERQKDGSCGWTETPELAQCLEDAEPDGCEHEGYHYEVGDSFPASDGCNTCSCMEGGVVGCTKIGCPIGRVRGI